MKKYLKYFYLALIIISIGVWFKFWRVEIDPTQSRIYKTLITYEKDDQATIEGAWVLFYYYPKNYFYLLEIDPETKLETGSGRLFESIFESQSKLEEEIFNIYGLNNFDQKIVMNRERAMSLMRRFGGVAYFNRFSPALDYGEVYINDLNYSNFMGQIDDRHRRRDEVLGIWLNMLIENFKRLPSVTMSDLLIEGLYDEIGLDYNYQTYKTLLRPLIGNIGKGEISDKFYFSFDKNNLEEKKYGDSFALVPYLKGTYDRQKLIQKLDYIKSEEWEKNDLTMSVQIKNHTKENRLAAKTAGYFRLRRFNVVEYIGSTSLLERTTILDYAFQPQKRKYISKVARTDRIYYMFDYREIFDYSLLLGGDFFGITNQ